MTPEEQAREQIDAQLNASGWAVQTKDKINLSAARGVAVGEPAFATGEPDNTLFVDAKALGTVEAKPAGHSLVGVEELEKKLREHHAAWTKDNLWAACAAAYPAKVKGRSQAGRFADLVALVRFALEQQPVLEPFAESVTARFNEWLMDTAKASVKFSPDQLAWLNLIRDHIATAISIEPEDLELSPFNQRGGLGKAHQLFGEQLLKLLDELNEALAA